MSSAEDIAFAMEGLIGGNDDPSTVTQFLDTGYPPLNFALSSRWDGGMPVGRVVELYGPESSGKTAISTFVMASAQRMGGVGGFNDHERSFSMKLAPKLGLDLKPGRFIYKKPRTFEESLGICVRAALLIREKKMIAKEAPIAWVFDSLASMVPSSKLIDPKTGLDREVGVYNMNDTTALARATSAAFPAFNQYVEELNICAIFLNQMRVKPGVTYGDPNTTPGGNAPKYYASIRIQLGSSMIAVGKDETKKVTGSQITARIIKNKVSRPRLSATWRFGFDDLDGTGRFEVTRSMVDFLVAEKILEKSGNMILWNGGKFYAGPLADKIDKEGDYDKLVALLPKNYEPPVIAEIEGAEPTMGVDE